jgi:hypothetical protein
MSVIDFAMISVVQFVFKGKVSCWKMVFAVGRGQFIFICSIMEFLDRSSLNVLALTESIVKECAFKLSNFGLL